MQTVPLRTWSSHSPISYDRVLPRVRRLCGAGMEEALVALLDDVHSQAMLVRSVPLAELCTAMARANASMSAVEQAVAMMAAKKAALRASHLVPVLRRLSLEDPDDALDGTTIVGDLTSILSGYGEHTMTFEATPALSLQLRCRPQAAGTGTRLWHSASLLAWACDTRWGGFEIRGKRVLELGCGLAAGGLACAALGASQVWLTDVDDAALASAQVSGDAKHPVLF